MLFWVGILAGAIFAWFAVKWGFYDMWALTFNVIISIYLAIFLRPLITDVIPVGSDTAYGDIFTVLATAIGIFCVLQSVVYILIIGQYHTTFPKLFEILGAGFLGFLVGFLLWNFASLLICITPIFHNTIVEEIGFNEELRQANTSSVSWWCDLVNVTVSPRESRKSTEQTIEKMLESIKAKSRIYVPKPAKPREKPKAVEEPLGPPPEVEDF